MSLLYKKQEDVVYEVDIKQEEGIINLLFSADCGKFGTDEILAEYNLTPKRLLEIIQDRDDLKEEEF